MGAAGYTAITLLEDSQAAALETFNLSLILDVENNPDQDILGLLRAAGAGGYEIDVNDYVLAFTAKYLGYNIKSGCKVYDGIFCGFDYGGFSDFDI